MNETIEPLIPNRKITAIIFDMDGVLSDVSSSYRQSIINTAASYGVLVTNEQINEIKLNGNANNDWLLTYNILLDNGIKTTLKEVTEKFQSIYSGENGLNKNETLIVNKQTLFSLSQNCKLGIATGRPRSEAIKFLSTKKIDGFFSALTCMEDSPPKPDPAPLLLAIDHLKLNVEKEQYQTIYFVGDTPDDIIAAVSASTNKRRVTPIGFLQNESVESYQMAQQMFSLGADRVFFSTKTLTNYLYDKCQIEIGERS